MAVDSDPNFPITEAQLSGNFCETLFFGIYLVTCCFCIQTLLLTGDGREERWLRPHEIRWLMASVALLLFIINTFDVAIGLLHNFNAFIKFADRPGGPAQELMNIADWINIARSVNQMVAMILGDFVLIYRCWIVHGRRWLVIVPSLILYLGGLAMAGKLLEVEANPSTHREISLNSNQILPWWNAFFAITAAQNTLTTSILIWRIWRVERQSEKYVNHSGNTSTQPRHLRRVMRVIGESGAAYTLMCFLTFIVSVSRSNALYPMSDMTLQATGIAFNVILVRSSARRDRQFTVFDANERTTTMTGRNSGSVGPISFTPGSMNRGRDSGDVELSLSTIRNDKSVLTAVHSSDDKSSAGDAEIYSPGIKVTKSIMTA